MSTLFKQKLNNKAFSLVEILVAVAISSIVFLIIGTFISSGTRFFNKQNTSVNLQSDLQEVSNKITDALMEATSINITETSDYIMVVTGDFAKYEEGSLKNQPKTILWKKADKKIYIFDKSVMPNKISDDADKGYCLSEYVSNLSIQFDESNTQVENSGENAIRKAAKPYIFNVALTVTSRNSSMSDSKTTKIRNSLSSLDVFGKHYIVE